MTQSNEIMKIMKKTWRIISAWFLPIIIFFMMIDAVFFTPLIRWSWGFYNLELIATMFIILFYYIIKNYFNTLRLEERIEELHK